MVVDNLMNKRAFRLGSWGSMEASELGHGSRIGWGALRLAMGRGARQQGAGLGVGRNGRTDVTLLLGVLRSFEQWEIPVRTL